MARWVALVAGLVVAACAAATAWHAWWAEAGLGALAGDLASGAVEVRDAAAAERAVGAYAGSRLGWIVGLAAVQAVAGAAVAGLMLRRRAGHGAWGALRADVR